MNSQIRICANWMKRIKQWGVGAMFLILAAQPSWSQESATGESVDDATPTLGATLMEDLSEIFKRHGLKLPDAQKTPSEDGAEDDQLILNFKNAKIDLILKFISDKTGKAVVRSSEVKGNFTIINPEKVTFPEALQLIEAAFELEGFTIIESDDLISVIPVAKAKQRGVRTYVDDQSIDGDSRVQTLMISLHHAIASQIKADIAPLVSEDSNLLADDRTNTLVITDTGGNIKRLAKIIARLDRQGRAGEIITEIFPLKYSNAQDLSKSVQSIMEHFTITREGKDEKKIKKGESDTRVFADQWTNSLIVSGPRRDVLLVGDLVEKLDTSKAEGFETRIFPLEYATAGTLARPLEEIAQARRSGYSQPKVVGDPWTNSIIATGFPEDLDIIEDVLKQLDTSKSQNEDTRIYDLKYADVLTLSEQLNAIFNNYRYSRGRSYGRRTGEEEVRLVQDQRLNALIITANPSLFPQIESIIELLDVKPEQSQEEPRIYPLQYSDAKELAETINGLFSEYQSQGGRFSYYITYSQLSGLTGKIRVTPEKITNSLIVLASSARAFEVVEDLIKQLDREAEALGDTFIFPLQNAKADELADLLTGLFEEKQDNRNRGFWYYFGGGDQDKARISNLIGRVKIVADRRTNSLLITTAQQNLKSINNMIRELDRVVAQVLIEVLIVEIGVNDEQNFGIQWGGDTGQVRIDSSALAEVGEQSQSPFLQDFENVTGVRTESSRNRRYNTMSSSQFDLVLNILESDATLNVTQ